jgi:hypothetical protein
VQAYAEAIAYSHAAADFTDSVEERADLQALGKGLLEHAQRIKSRHLSTTATAGPAPPRANIPPQRSRSATAAGAPISPKAGPPPRSQSSNAAGHLRSGNAPPGQTAQAPPRSSSLLGSVDAFLSKFTSNTAASSSAASGETPKTPSPLGDGAYCLQLGPPAAITDSLRLPDVGLSF